MKVALVENVQKSDCFNDQVTRRPPQEWLTRVQSSLFPWFFFSGLDYTLVATMPGAWR